MVHYEKLHSPQKLVGDPLNQLIIVLLFISAHCETKVEENISYVSIDTTSTSSKNCTRKLLTRRDSIIIIMISLVLVSYVV